MKKPVYLILSILTLVFPGCEKHESAFNFDKQLNGEWKYIKAVGGFTGDHVIQAPAGSTIVFSADRRYKKKLNGTMVEEGVYELIKLNSVFTGKRENAIKLVGSSFENARLVSVKNDSLWLSDNHVEPYGYLYIRLK